MNVIPNTVHGLLAYYYDTSGPELFVTDPVIAWSVTDEGIYPVVYTAGDGIAVTERPPGEPGGCSNFVGCYTDPDEGREACLEAARMKSAKQKAPSAKSDK